MDSDDEAVPKESTKKSKTSSMDPVELNNLVVSMRKTTRQAKIHTIRTLTRKIELYRKKKGTEKQVQSFQKKAERLLEELKVIKKLDIDWISKFSLYNTSDLQGVVNKRVETKSMVRVATAKVLQTKVRGFRAAHKDWEELASYLISKTTGRRFKKRKLGKTIKLKPAAHLDTDQPRIGPALDSGLSVKDGKSKKGQANEVAKDKEMEDMKERSKVIQDLEGDESEEEEEEDESEEEGDEESEEEEAEESEESDEGEEEESEEEQGEDCEVQKKESRVKSVNSDSEENVENESGDSGQESENSDQGIEGQESDSDGQDSDNDGQDSDNDGQGSDSDGQDSDNDGQDSDNDGQGSDSDGQDSDNDGQDSDNDGQGSDSDGQDSDGSDNENESDNNLESEKMKETIRISRIKPEKPKKGLGQTKVSQNKISKPKISKPNKTEQKKATAGNPKQKQKAQPKNLSKGLMVIKKFNLEDSPEEEEDKPDVSFLFEKQETAKVSDKGIKDSFFQGSDSEESQNDSGGDISDVSDEEGSSEYPQQTLVDSSFTKSLSNQKRKGKDDHSVGRDSKFGGRGGRFDRGRGDGGRFDRGRGGRGRDSFRGGDRFERGGSSFSGRGRGDGFSRGRGDGGFSRGRDGFSRGRDGFSRGRDGFSRGRGEGGFSRGRGDGFIRGRGDGRGRGRGDRREYSQDSRDFQGSGKRFHRDDNFDRGGGYSQDNKRTKWEKADRPAGNQWPAKDPKKDSATKELHPSWQASLKKKQELQIMNFQGKKTVFNDD